MSTPPISARSVTSPFLAGGAPPAGGPHLTQVSRRRFLTGAVTTVGLLAAGCRDDVFAPARQQPGGPRRANLPPGTVYAEDFSSSTWQGSLDQWPSAAAPDWAYTYAGSGVHGIRVVPGYVAPSARAVYGYIADAEPDGLNIARLVRPNLPTGDQRFSAAIWSGVPAGTPYSGPPPRSGMTSYTSIGVRWAASGAVDGYSALFQGWDGRLLLKRWDAGTQVDLVTVATGLGAGTHRLAIEAVGTGASVALKVYVDDVLRITHTDTSPQRKTAGVPALVAWQSWYGSEYDPFWGDLVYEDLGAGSGSSPHARRLNAGALPLLADLATTGPDFAAYAALNVPDLPVGGSYVDPVTGERVYKLWDDGTQLVTGYPNSGPYISHPIDAQGTGTYFATHADGTCMVRDARPDLSMLDAQGRPLALVVSPVRSMPYVGETCWMFSKDPATPTIAYLAQWDAGAAEVRLRRWDTRTNAEAPTAAFPAGGAAIPWVSDRTVSWLTSDATDSLFALQHIHGAFVVFYNTRTQTVSQRYSFPNFDEGKMAPSGTRYCCWVGGLVTVVDPATGQVTVTAPSSVYAGHSSVGDDDLWVDAEDDGIGNWNPATGVRTVQPNRGTAAFCRMDYRITTWRQAGVPVAQRYFLAPKDAGDGEEAFVDTWTLHAGTVYRSESVAGGTGYAAGPLCGFVVANLGVHSGSAAQVERYIGTLNPVASLADLSSGPGAFHDVGTGTIYVRMPDGGSPAGRVRRFVKASGGAVSAIAFMAIDGGDRRLLCHHYSLPPYEGGQGDTYYWRTRAGQSLDGRAVMFASTMGYYGTRTGVFVVFPPTVPA